MRYRTVTMPAARLIPIAAVAAGLALAGCGGGQPVLPAATPRPFLSDGGQPAPADRSLAGLHACALIPAATVTATIGQLEEPPTESPDGLTCFYNTRENSESAGPSYILNITTRSLYGVAKSLADGEAQARLVQLAPIRGIGDEGYSTANSRGGPAYDAMAAKGGAAAAIQVNSVFPAAEQQAQRLLAVAVARL
jgi:hypothetical protein